MQNDSTPKAQIIQLNEGAIAEKLDLTGLAEEQAGMVILAGSKSGWWYGPGPWA